MALMVSSNSRKMLFPSQIPHRVAPRLDAAERHSESSALLSNLPNLNAQCLFTNAPTCCLFPDHQHLKVATVIVRSGTIATTSSWHDEWSQPFYTLKPGECTAVLCAKAKLGRAAGCQQPACPLPPPPLGPTAPPRATQGHQISIGSLLLPPPASGRLLHQLAPRIPASGSP